MTGLIQSNILSYQAILENAFASFLTQQGASEKTQANYISDLRFFIRFLVATLNTINTPPPTTEQQLVKIATTTQIEQFILFQQSQNTPSSTINRRLSALRMFFQMSQEKGWLESNPTQGISNVQQAPKNINSLEQLLDEFKEDLDREGASKVTIKNYVSDIRQLLTWVQAETFVEQETSG